MDSVVKNKIIIFSSSQDLFKTAVEDFVRLAIAAVTEKGEFTVVLSGGNTAKLFFNAFVEDETKQRIPWPQIKFFFGDERYVPADDPESNYHSAQELLFSKVAVPAENIYRIPTEFSDPKASAEAYEKTIREFPQFDLVYLGLGDDGHTASLMPYSDVVKACPESGAQDKNSRWVESLWVPHLKMYRITLTPCAINRSAGVCFMVTGVSKAPAVAQTLEGPVDPQRYPAQLIQCAEEKVIWYLDQAAAEKLNFPREASV